MRHGQTEWNREERFRGQYDIPLNETGLEQARITGERIRNQYEPTAVYASPLGRALKTAEVIAECLVMTAIAHPDLLDIDYGKLKGLKGEEAHNAWPEVMRLWLTAPGEVQFPEGENLDVVRVRAERFLTFVQEEFTGESVVGVGHTVINRIMILAAMGLDNNRMWDLGQGNCAINVLEHKNDHWRIISMNDTGHLQ